MSPEWHQKWVVFDEGVLSYSSSQNAPPEETVSVSMNRVISIRTDVSFLAFECNVELSTYFTL
jgi:hypothetical protein